MYHYIPCCRFYYEFQRISAANGIEGAPAGTVATAGGDVKKTN